MKIYQHPTAPTIIIIYFTVVLLGRETSDGTENVCGQVSPGIESRWGARHSPEPTHLPVNGYRHDLQEIKRPGRGVENPSLSSVEVKARVEL